MTAERSWSKLNSSYRTVMFIHLPLSMFCSAAAFNTRPWPQPSRATGLPSSMNTWRNWSPVVCSWAAVRRKCDERYNSCHHTLQAPATSFTPSLVQKVKKKSSHFSWSTISLTSQKGGGVLLWLNHISFSCYSSFMDTEVLPLFTPFAKMETTIIPHPYIL